MLGLLSKTFKAKEQQQQSGEESIGDLKRAQTKQQKSKQQNSSNAVAVALGVRLKRDLHPTVLSPKNRKRKRAAF